MYKATITDRNGKRTVIDPFPNEDVDLYSLVRLLDKSEIKGFSLRLSNKK